MKPIIKAEGIAKQYQIGAQEATYQTLRDALTETFKSPRRLLRRRSRARGETIWALRDIDFEVQQGEVVGFIGRNGAGKSTLLKILSRITEPTAGRIELRGRIASLLEVGTGFHPELTGRENVYLNGAILGMKTSEIKRKFDEIVAFAEIEKFISTPVKHYSSGMYVRLAFAVAVHLEPEILIVDEVLAVGDQAFQQKCLVKMREVTNEGRTVLVVSHSMAAVSRLCHKIMWLDEGRMRAFGSCEEAIQTYLGTQRVPVGEYARDESESVPTQPVRVTGARLRTSSGEIASLLDARAGFSIEVDYQVLTRTLAWVGFVISTGYGFDVLSATDGDVDVYAAAPREPGVYTSVCTIPGGLLNAGRYSLTLYAARSPGDKVEIFDFLEHVLAFDVGNPSGIGSYMPKDRYGVISPSLDWKLMPAVGTPPDSDEASLAH
jgi:lipopolysaccharide transport system ATP-binding protein